MRFLVRTCSVLFLAGVSLAQPPAGDGASIRILQPGKYIDDVAANSGEIWWVLYATPGDGVRLRYTPLCVTDVPDWGPRVQAEGFADEEVVLLFSGTREIPRGPVATTFLGNLPLTPGTEVWLGQVGRDLLRVHPFRRSVISNTPMNEATLGEYRIELCQGGSANQTLFKAQWSGEPSGGSDYNDYLPSLLWAGDLDKDDRLDLLLDVRQHYAAPKIALYLSSHAQPGERVHLVAQADGPGGC